MFLFAFVCFFEIYSSGQRGRLRQRRAPSLLNSSGLVLLLLPPAPSQAGRDCSALCVLFSHSLMCALLRGRRWQSSVFRLMTLFCFFSAIDYNSRHRKRTRQLRAPSLLDSSGLVPILLLPAPSQAGRACSASCVLFSYSCKYSFDLTDENFASSLFTIYNFWYQLKSLTIPEAIRHPTRETALLILISPPHQVRTAALVVCAIF